MNVYVVSYDLNKPRTGDAYKNLIAALKSFPAWMHELDSTWFVQSPLSSTEVANSLLKHLDSSDKLIVYQVYPEKWAVWGFSQEALSWLNSVTTVPRVRF